ncbi:endolytic transglycosylase MltG [Rossellomorea aquimaris]|nr:endolytic transglycosylase MltG [Rossellomorea aquimaris]
MAVKWMNALVVFVFLLTVLANKDHFLVNTKEATAADLNIRTENGNIDRTAVMTSMTDDKEVVVDSPSTSQVQKEIVYVFRIEGGMTSKDVSEMLYELGMISDGRAFGDYLIENGYAGKIQIGSYRVTNDMSFEEVAYKITN